MQIATITAKKMKKAILIIIAAMGLSLNGMAQDTYVTSAKVALTEKKYDEAKEDIDKAMTNPETKEKPKALLAKVQIYFAMQDDDKFKASNPYREGTQALFKLIEVKPDYEKSTVDQYLLVAGYHFYNDGVRAYNDKKLADASDYMKSVMKISGMKRFEKLPPEQLKKIDTIAANADQILASSAYYLAKYDEAIPLLTAVKNNPITRIPSVYECLIDAYNRQNNKTEALATIQEARKAFPDDVTIRNYELNYYIQSGKDDEMVKKLEDASAKDPNNPDLLFNIATTYLRMAGAKDGKKPENAAELIAKSEDAFQKALKISPDNAEYNYNFGALYYNQATDYNEQMNAITGTSDADQKKYDNMKAQRDAMFAKSIPYFEKASSVYGAEKDMKEADRKTYKNTLKAQMQIYSSLNKMDKYADVKKKYESAN